jgi:replicative DNA helicase
VTWERLLRQIVELVKKHKIKIVALDYIQEFRTKQKYESERVMFREIARTFRHTMKQLRAASIVLTQVTNPEPGKPPTKDNIRECKDIGHGAEVIAMGWEPTEDIRGKDGTVVFEAKSKVLLLDKTKSGGKQTIKMEWDPVSACFNRVLQPAYMDDEEQAFYNADGDADMAWGQPDEFDDAIGSSYM